MPAMTSKTFINASPDAVWKVLVDFPSYPEWNSFNPKMECELRPGGRVTFQLLLDGFKQREVNARMIRVDEGREIQWGAEPLYFEVLGKGRHSFTVEASTDENGQSGTLFSHTEVFDGPVSWLMPQKFYASVQKAFDILCRDIKARVEGGSK
ncbi:hypothetical protein F5884DRAFT_754021 [Xylogone sp. PMI_703]|nr:hypothetical protein F5884DRAFT_754021 [Xylogone sp. PMI_703]